MPSILYVITDLEVGGVPLHLFHLARAMRQRGFEPAVVSLAPPGPVTAMLAEEMIEVEDCGGRGGWDFRVIARLGKIIRRRQPDLVHSLLFHANVAARRAAKRAGIPPDRVVCEIQTVEVERKWHLMVDRFTHRGCRFTIGNSPSVIDHLAARARIPRERLRLVKGGIDLARIDAAPIADRLELGLSPTDRVILWVGRLDPVKGLDSLIGAFSLLPTPDARLLLVGGGPLEQDLRGRIDAAGLTGRVSLLGPRSDVPSLLKMADVFAFPSRTEGLPNALLEAMAAACPIVTTDVPGCRDLVQHKSNGLVVPYGDVQALGEALKHLVSAPAPANELGRRARASVEHDWRIESTYEQYAQAYHEMTGDEAR